MNTEHTSAHADPHSVEELDEAAVWIARLRAPDRSSKLEKGFRRWLDAKPSHTAAFETISTAWELSGALKRRPFPKLSRWERAGFRVGFMRSTAAVALAAVLIAVGAILYLRTMGVATGVGEQRVLTLDDGTWVSLNTASRLVVRYDKSERRVELDRGEALFEVVKDPRRPFIVIAGNRQIRALGTSFVVREDGGRLAVTLLEGKVAVSRKDGGGVSLAPGQRITLRNDVSPRIDRPSLGQITAWRRGQVELEETPLSEAADEMNRYSTLKLSVERPEAAKIRINGIFRAGDTEGFAAAVARSYALTVQRRSGEIILAGTPSNKALSQITDP